MGGGILSGLIWGTVLSVISLVVASLLAPLPPQEPDNTRPVARLSVPEADNAPSQTETTPPDSAAVKPAGEGEVASVISVPAGSEFRREMPDSEPSLPGADTGNMATTAPRVAAPVPETETGSPVVDTTPSVQPQTALSIGAAPSAPQIDDSGTSLAPATAASPGTQPAAEPLAPAAPQAEAEPQEQVAIAALPVSRPETVQNATPVAPLQSEAETGDVPEAEAAEPTQVTADTVSPEVAGVASGAGAADAAVDVARGAEIETPSEAETVETVDTVGTAGMVNTEAETVAEVTQANTVEVATATNAQAGGADTVQTADADTVETTNADTVETAGADAVSARTGDVVVGLAPTDVETATEPGTQDAGTVDVAAAAPQPQPVTVEGVEPAVEPSAPETDTPPAVTDRAPGSGGSGIGVRVIPLTERNKGSTRLPRIATAQPEAEPAAVATTANATPQLTALARNAAPFENPGSKPLFSILLIDEAGALSRDVLTTFSFPVTFAVDPTRPDAAEAVAAYRRAGFEVVLLATGFPEGARPQDIEVTLGNHLAAIDSAVAVMAPEGESFVDNRDLTAQVIAVLGDQGHGLVTWDSGLNAAKKAADKVGHPAALAFRSLDADGENGTTMRRYLDRAVFKASQDGHVIMVGHTRAATVTALFEWALESKAGQVALAPVSAVLRAQ